MAGVPECLECGAEIADKCRSAMYCDKKCGARFRSRVAAGDAVMPERRCLWCDSDISGKQSRARFCGQDCRQWYYRKAEWVATEPRCLHCGELIAHRRIDTVYCDRHCKHAHKTRDQVKRYGKVSAARDAWVASDPRCATCGESIAERHTGAKYCGRICFGATARQRTGYRVDLRKSPRSILLRWGFTNPHPRGSKQYDHWKYLANQEERRIQAREYGYGRSDANAAKRLRRRAWRKGVDSRVVTQADIATIRRRQNGKCYYCGGETVEMHIDHVVPLSRGGRHAIGNLVLACASCNVSKSDSLLVEWRHGLLNGGGYYFSNLCSGKRRVPVRV